MCVCERERESKRMQAGGMTEGEGEAGFMGLDPRTPGSGPEPKADT